MTPNNDARCLLCHLERFTGGSRFRSGASNGERENDEMAVDLQRGLGEPPQLEVPGTLCLRRSLPGWGLAADKERKCNFRVVPLADYGTTVLQ